MQRPTFDFSDLDAHTFCPNCGAAFALISGSCNLCNVALVDRHEAQRMIDEGEQQARQHAAELRASALRVVHSTQDGLEADAVAARLEEQGIAFVTRRPRRFDPFGGSSAIEFLVAPEDVAAAEAALADLGDVDPEFLEKWFDEHGGGESPEGESR